MQFNTPLRYPGGKAKLTSFLKLVFEENNLLDGHYVEPYAGGAGIALALLYQSYVKTIHLNDLNQAVYAFWHSVLNNNDALCKLIRDTPVTMDEWHKQKEVMLNPEQYDTVALGFATFFLNRTNRSGILMGGVIGGKGQSGDWKLDVRFNKPDLINRIEKLALYRSRIKLYNLDAAYLISDVLPRLPANTLVYLDPPYYVKGKGLYQNHYTHDDHKAIAKLVQKEIKLPWIVSYDYAPEIMEMYTKSRGIVYGLNYSAQEKYEGMEAMFFSKKLVIPDVANPSKLKAA